MRPLLALLPVLLLACCAYAQEQPTMLADFETLDGASASYGSKDRPVNIEINHDPEFVSSGEASLRASSTSSPNATGNTYAGVSVAFPEPLSFRGVALTFDAWSTEAEATRALYVRGYDTANQCVLSWNCWSSPVRAGEKAQVRLYPGLSMDGFGWEPSMVKSPNLDEVVRLEFIIGTAEKGVLFGIFLDNVCLEPTDMKAFEAVEEAKPLYLETALVNEGAANAFILAPDAAEWTPVAEELAEGLKQATGVQFPIKRASEVSDADLSATNVVALGALSNNRRLLYLYSHTYTYADDYYPGPDGYVVQSIHDPWGTGRNVILVGATTVAGAREGIAQILPSVGNGELVEPVFKFRLAGDAARRLQGTLDREPDEAYIKSQQEAAQKALDQGAHTGLFGMIANVGSDYALTRKDGYATLFAWLVRRAKEHHDTDPGTFGGPWGMDSDFMIHRVLPGWDQVEESPALTDDDRLAVTKVLFDWVRDEGAPSAQSVVNSTRVRHNHETFPALGLLFSGDYFSKYYDALEARQWLKVSAAAFEFQSKAGKPHEDCNGYQWLTLYHTMQYALAKPDPAFFDNGAARRFADFAVLCTDNLGYAVTYGDTGAFTGWWSENPFLQGAQWHYQDARWAWELARKQAVSGRSGVGQYTVNMTGQPPQDLLGTIAWPLDEGYYKSWGGDKEVPLEKAVDKLVFREGFGPDDAYLLLDGLSNGGHKHLDGNSISRWTENGRIWLADADYILSLPKYHNGVLILRDGQSAPIPGFVELEHVVDLPNFGAGSTVYRDYAGVDWHRNIVRVKDGYFLVADRMVAQEDGDYSFRVVWNTVGEVELDESGLTVEQSGQYARIALTPDCRLLLHDDPDYGKNWSGYKHIKEPVVRVLRGVRNCRLQAGQQFTLFSLLHASGEAPSTANLVRINDNTVAVTGLDEPALMTVGGGEAYDVFEAAQIDAALSMLTPTHLFTVGATRVQSNDMLLERPLGIDAETDLTAGLVQFVDPATTVTKRPAAHVEQRVGAGSPQDLKQYILGRIPPVSAGAEAGAGEGLSAPEIAVDWDYRERLTAYLVTNNAGAFEAVEAGARITCDPEPLESNVFGGEPGTNTVDNVTDGVLNTTDGGVMWGDDVPVTINLFLDNDYDLSRLVLKQWFATSSSKRKLFQLGSLKVTASSDGFQQDSRVLLDVTDTEDHGNWGAPGYGPHAYDFPVAAKVKALRLELTPRPGTAIYLAEVEVWGNREGLGIDVDTMRKRRIPVHQFNSIVAADLDGDGVQELIAGSGNGKVYALRASGEMLWVRDTGSAVNAVAAVDFDGDGIPAVVAGGMGATVKAFSAQGEPLWDFPVPYYKRAAFIRTLFPADLKGDGRQVAIAGADNWHFYALDGAGKKLWQYESVHGSTCGSAADVNGDGADDVVCGTEYYWWHVVRPDGKALFSYSTKGGPHANDATTARLDAAGGRNVLFGGADGNVHCLSPDGGLRWMYNTGDEVTRIAPMDIDGDGIDEIITASMSFNVYAVNAAGEALWRVDLRSEVLSLAVAATDAGKRVIVGCADGGLYVMDARDGSVLAARREPERILQITTTGSATGARAVYSTAEGGLKAISLK